MHSKVLRFLFFVYFFSYFAHAADVLQEIMNRVAEGNNRISGNGERAYLLLGNTGVGKSTLAYLLINQELVSREDETGELVFDAKTPLDHIKIGHQSCSETSIPNKCATDPNDTISKCKARDGTLIWDCPGFHDTSVIQEIANAYYIRKLLEQNKLLKFTLVITEASLSERGNQLANVLERFCNMFNNIEEVKDSVNLVITAVKPGKNVSHLKVALNKVLKENQSLSGDAKKMLGYLMDKITLFHMPKNQGETVYIDLFSEISSQSEFIESRPALGKFSLSEKATGLCRELIEMSENNLKTILSILGQSLLSNPFTHTHLVDKYKNIKKWLPQNIFYERKNAPELHDPEEWFITINLIERLAEAANEIGRLLPNELENNVGVVEKMFNILEDYVAVYNKADVNEMKEIIQHYAYATRQMLDYLKFFSSLINEDISIYDELNNEIHDTIQTWQEFLGASRENAILTLDIKEDIQNIEYFNTALTILNLFEEKCLETRATCHACIGDLQACEGQITNAIESYIRSLELNSVQPQIYKQLAKLFTQNGEFLKAAILYTTTGNTLKLKHCAAKFIENNVKDPDIHEKLGDLFFEIGPLNKAEKHFNIAAYHSDSQEQKQRCYHQIAQIHNGEQSEVLSKEYEERARTGNFSNLESITIKDILDME